MNTQQPEALRLAGIIEQFGGASAYEAAAELRRLCAENAALQQGYDAARLERERICAAIKAEDDYCVDQGNYMLDSDDCIKIVRGEWVRPDFSVVAARKKGENHD